MIDSQQTTLVLGGTGRTGSLVAQKLIERDDIEKVTGRPAITFQDFARRNAHAWTLQAAK